MSDLKKIVSERINQLRVSKGWTLKIAAEKLSEIYPEPVSRQRWGNWELDGYRTPKDEQLIAIAKLFGVSPAFLKGYTNNQDEEGRLSNYVTANSPAIATRAGIVRAEQASDSVAFLVERLRARNLNPDRVLFVTATDGSMKGIIDEGDEYLIDLEHTQVIDADLFAINVNNRIWIRWIRPEIDGTYSIVAEDTSLFPPERVDAERLAALDVVGRVAMVLRYR